MLIGVPLSGIKAGLYYNSQRLVCVQTKAVGKQCDADKVSSTYNSLANGTCDESTDTPTQAKKWVYVVVAVCILGGMVGTLVALYFMHKKHRDAEREKRLQYWREQVRALSAAF